MAPVTRGLSRDGRQGLQRVLSEARPPCPQPRLCHGLSVGVRGGRSRVSTGQAARRAERRAWECPQGGQAGVSTWVGGLSEPVVARCGRPHPRAQEAEEGGSAPPAAKPGPGSPRPPAPALRPVGGQRRWPPGLQRAAASAGRPPPELQHQLCPMSPSRRTESGGSASRGPDRPVPHTAPRWPRSSSPRGEGQQAPYPESPGASAGGDRSVDTPMAALPTPRSRGVRGPSTRALARVGRHPEVLRPSRGHACCSPPRPPRRPAPVREPRLVSGLSHPRPARHSGLRPTGPREAQRHQTRSLKAQG